MELCAVLAVGMVASQARAAGPGQFVLRNEHLTARFEGSAAGPRLAAIEHHATGAAYHFEGSQEIALAVVRVDAVDDPDLPVPYDFQDRFLFQTGQLRDDGAGAEFVFDHDLLQAKVVYELQPDGPVLRKRIICTAGDAGAYIAGVTIWLFVPDHELAWPAAGAVGQPAVVCGPSGGYFLALEWPRARAVSIDGDVRVGYRPGYDLEAGESQEVAAGSIGFFGSDPQAQDPLDAARHAFFKHVAQRVKPKIPFPVKFTTWGPWLGHAREGRILEIMDDLAHVGVDLFHFDAGWQWPDHPYSERLPALRDADDEAWDRQMTQPERLPNGFLPIVRAAKARGMGVSVWLDACGNVFVRECDEWAVRDKDGEPVYARTWEGRWPEAPRQSLASAYGDRLQEFVLEAMERYDLDGIMFDNNSYMPDYAPDRRSLANGWNSEDVQLRKILEILDEAERRRPGIYRFYCRGSSWPWALLHATHIHAGDPGMSKLMAKAMATDCPARALAFERRHAWRRHYENFVPPWGVKGDIAGWSLQQRSPIPVNLRHTGQLIPAGEGWTQNMFTCFATTAVRDIRFSFRQMPAFDRDILREWLAWDRERAGFILNCRPLFELGDDPNEGVVGYSHIGDGRGVIYLFNQSFDLAEATVRLDEGAGFRTEDRDLSACLVYPMKGRLGAGTLAYGDTLRVPIIGKDCVVLEIGLEAPEQLVSYAEYEQAAQSVRRSHDPLFLTPAAELVEALKAGPVCLEVGDSPRDRRLAAQIVETLGSAIGSRVSIQDLRRTPVGQAHCRLVIGTHEGLASHSEIGDRFRETLYNRYVAWNGSLVSAPLVAALPGPPPRTFCLVAPRPEQLSRLSIYLTASVLDGAQELAAPQKPEGVSADVLLSTAVPAIDRPALRFRPVVRGRGNRPLPGDLDLVRFQVHAEHNRGRELLWQEDVPPFVCVVGAEWLEDRIISLADLSGRDVKLNLTAGFVDGREDVQMTIGFDRVALLELKGTP